MGQIKSGLAVCLVLLILTCAATSQTQTPSELKVGGPAPELELLKLLQAPEGIKIDSNSLKGKVVVLEFWATWCAPCIVAMPHLNELADKFKDRPVRFISITAPPKNESRQSSSEIGHWSSAEGVLAASGSPLKNLVDGIAGLLGRPVVDETNLKGKYDWDVLFDAKNPESIVDAVKKDLGLELTRAKRQIEVLVVEESMKSRE